MSGITVISGVGLRDDLFSIDKSIIGEEITWNVTRIQRDALTGAFGKRISVSMSALPPMTKEMAQRIDWKKVEAMLGVHLQRPEDSPLDRPALQVALLRNDGVVMRIPVDGNHRICARRIAGFVDFECFVVPPTLEQLYRVNVKPL